LKTSLAGYEKELHDTFFGGSKPALVDYMLWPWFEYFPRLEEAGFVLNADGKLPKLAAWVEAMQADEAVQKTKVSNEIVTRFTETMKQGEPDYDIE
jgi:glutathione S-transferase